MKEKASSPKEPQNSSSFWQKLFAIGFGLLLCGLLLFLAEAVLSVLDMGSRDPYQDPFVGFDPGSSLFEITHNDDVYRTRPEKLRYFNNQHFFADKPKNTTRIFTLGGSTAFGRPYDAKTSFSNWMRLYLEASNPSQQFEVVNAGGISYASYRILVLMKELVAHDPDLFVVYTGHNEFLEERSYSKGVYRSPTLRGLRKNLARLRTVNTLRSVLFSHEEERFGIESEVKTKLDVWEGLNAFTRDEDLAAAIHKHFQYNLRLMIELSRDNKIPIIFVGPASNLKDFSPFKSEPQEGLDEDQQARFDETYQRGQQLLDQNLLEEALAEFAKALELDDTYADLHYTMGLAFFGLRDFHNAKAAFVRAKEEDVCPLRSTQPICRTIANVTQSEQVPYVDLKRVLEQKCVAEYGHDILGNEYFLDHVHPRISVHALIAELVIEKAGESGILRSERPLNLEEMETIRQDLHASLDQEYYALRDLSLAKVLGWARKIDEAERILDGAVESDALSGDFHFIRGLVFERKGETQKAVDAYRKAVAIDPDYFDASFNLGKSLQKLGSYSEASVAFERAVELDPNSAEASYNLGVCYLGTDMAEKALGFFHRTRRLDPQYPRLDFRLGVTHQHLGQFNDAKKFLSRYLENSPEDGVALSYLGTNYFKTGDSTTALSLLDRAATIDPNLETVYRQKAVIHNSIGNDDQALDALRKLIELRPDDLQLKFDLGIFFHKRGSFQKAIEQYIKVVEMDPTFSRGFNNLGAALCSVNRLDEAIGAFKKTIKIEPESADAHYNLAQLLLLVRKPEQAAKHVNKARELGVKIDPELERQIREMQK